MKNTLRLVPLVLAAAISVGCNKTEPAKPAETAAAAAPAPAAIPPVPAASDMEGWKTYLKAVVSKHVDRRYRRPFMYFIPAAGDDEAQRQYDAQLENVQNAVGRGIQSGAMLAFGGPDPGRTAQVIVDAFQLASPKSLKGVRVVYIGTKDQEERVRAATAASEAELIFEEMANLPPADVNAPASIPGQGTPVDQPASLPGEAPAAPATDPAAAAPTDPAAPAASGENPEGGEPPQQ